MILIIFISVFILFNSYFIIIEARNFLYDKKILTTTCFEIPTIHIGNLNMGGTGKTPQVIYIAELLNTHFNIAVLSRGYGRKTKGFVKATNTISPKIIGDENVLIFNRLNQKNILVACEDRKYGIDEILKLDSSIKGIILDDAFQHRKVQPHLNILLCNYQKPFYKDKILPWGRLRETRKGAKRADIVVVTKCPSSLNLEEQKVIITQIKHYTQKDIPIFFSRIFYEDLKPLYSHKNIVIEPEEAILVSGIAYPQSFETYLAEKYKILHHFVFKDHHDFTLKDVIKIKEFWINNSKAIIIITEKDFVKLVQPEFKELLIDLPIFYLPISTVFLHDGRKFDDLILKTIIK